MQLLILLGLSQKPVIIPRAFPVTGMGENDVIFKCNNTNSTRSVTRNWCHCRESKINQPKRRWETQKSNFPKTPVLTIKRV